MLILYILPIFG